MSAAMESPVAVAPDAPPTPLWRRLLASSRTRTGLIMMAVVALVAFLGPLFAPHSPSEIVATPFTSPSATFWLGTDYLGHDALSQFLWGGGSLIVMAICSALLGVAAGAVLGMTAAYTRGWIDGLIMRGADVLLAFPAVVFALLFVSIAGPNPVLLVISVAIAHVPSVARVIRSASLRVVGLDYVAWSRAVGIGPWQILTRDVLPNVTSPLMVELGLRLMWSVGALAALSFLGYGIQPPASDWGLMINLNRNGLSVQPATVIAPIIAIAVFTIGGNLFAEGVARVIARTDGKKS